MQDQDSLCQACTGCCTAHPQIPTQPQVQWEPDSHSHLHLLNAKCLYNCILLSLSNNVLLLIIPLVVSVKMCIRLFCLSISKNTRATQIKKDIHWQSMVNDEHELQRRRFNTLSVFHSLIRVSSPDIKEFL